MSPGRGVRVGEHIVAGTTLGWMWTPTPDDPVSSSGCTVCRYPDWAAAKGTDHGGGVGAVSSTMPIRPWTTARVSCSTRLPIASTWMEWARWSAKYTTMARLANISTRAPLTASRGKSSVRLPTVSPTVYRPAAA